MHELMDSPKKEFAMTHELIQKLVNLVRTERKITDQIVQLLVEIDEQKIHLKMGYSSIYIFLIQYMGYSASSAYRRYCAMKLYKKTPEISEKVQDGSLNLTQLSELERCSREKPIDDIKNVLQKIENKNTSQTQQIIAQEFDLPIIAHEKKRTQKDESVLLQITLTKEQYELFEKAAHLLSHVKPGATHAEVIEILANKLVKQKIGKEVQQNQNDKILENESNFRSGSKKSKRKPIAQKIRRYIFKQAQHQCEYVSFSGQRCEAKSLLEIDHIMPVSRGGTNKINNLRIFCRAHNQERNQEK